MKKSVKKGLKIAAIIVLLLLAALCAIGVRAYIEVEHIPNEEDLARY